MLWNKLSVPSGFGRAHHVAAHAACLTVEERKAALRRGRERFGVARREAVERRIEKDQGALEARDRAAEILVVWGAPIGSLKEVLVGRVGVHCRHRARGVRMPHLDGVQDRQLRLLLERGCTPVPELALQERRIHCGRCTALAQMIADPFRDAAMVSEAAADIVAGRASQRAVLGQARVEIEPTPERSAVRRQFIALEHIDRRPRHRIDARWGIDAPVDQLIEALLLLLHRHRAMRCAGGFCRDTRRASGGGRDDDQHRAKWTHPV